MHRHGIYSQACFVLGFPGEIAADVKETAAYIKKLTRAGLDEIAQFIITPIPGSSIADQFSSYDDLTQLTFSPRWRTDYKTLHRRRLIQYFKFLCWKTLYHPQKLMRQFFNIWRGSFETKMEQALYRVTLFRLSMFRRVQRASTHAGG
jgi:anaerobic magnesium-protoporphyrin IX monomethyl ester cyclase